MKKTLLAFMALAILAGAAWGAPKAKVSIALIIESTVDDKGWGQAMHDAILAVQKKYGAALVEYNYSEKMKPVDAGSAARQYASRGYDIILAHGAQFKNLVLELAEEYPQTSFAFGTSAEIGPKNVFTYMPMSEETGYINGIIAGLVTKTNVIGVVGPIDAGDSARYIRGFILGAKAVNAKAEVKVAFTGSFADYVKAAELAHTGQGERGRPHRRRPAGDRRPPRRGRVQGQAHLVARPGHAPDRDARGLQGRRGLQLRLRGRHRGPDRQAAGGGPRGREHPDVLHQQGLRVQVQRQGRHGAHGRRPQGRGPGEDRHHRLSLIHI